MGAITNNSLIEVGTGPIVRPKTEGEKERVRVQLIAQQEFVRCKAHANLSERGLYLAFDAAADMRDMDRFAVLKYVMAQKAVRRRERISIGKMVHRIHRRVANKGLRIHWGAAVQYRKEGCE